MELLINVNDNIAIDVCDVGVLGCASFANVGDLEVLTPYRFSG